MSKDSKEQFDSKIEEIQEHIINAVGRFFKRKEVENMTIKELLNICIPNHIRIDLEFQSPKNKEEYES